MVSASQKLKTYFIELETKQHRGKQRMLTELLWYDEQYGIMYKIYGDQLRMKWVPEWNKSVPDVEWDKVDKRWVTKDPIHELRIEYRSNKEEIDQWIRDVASRFGAEINTEETDSRGIAIDVDENLSTQIEYAMDRKGFRYSEL